MEISFVRIANVFECEHWAIRNSGHVMGSMGESSRDNRRHHRTLDNNSFVL